MTYEEAYLYMKEAGKRGSVYGTETVKELLLRLGNPQDRVPVVHIAGTNGKGSIFAFVGDILDYAGYVVGRYISPSGTISDKWTLYERIGICTDHGDRDPGLRGYGGSRASDSDRI